MSLLIPCLLYTSGWQLYSISRWTAEDGKKLKRHLEIEFDQKKNRQINWDDVAMFCYPEEYKLGIRPMNKDDIIAVSYTHLDVYKRQ